MPRKKIGGVYMILNTKNGKKYIGSAESFIVRKGQHLKLLQQGKHNCRIQPEFDRDGGSFFEISLIEIIEEPIQLVPREQHWMNFYKSYDIEFGYNINPTAGSVLGMKHREETKRKIGMAVKAVKSEEVA